MENNLERENSIINIKIDNELELYNRFDETNQTISDDIISYIENKIEEIPIYNSIEIDIKCDKIVDIENFSKSYQKYINKELKKKNKEIIFNKIRKILLLIIGIIFILLSFALSSKVETIITEIISIIGSFSIWEVADLVLLTGNDLKIEKLNLKRKLYCSVKQI